MNYIQACETIQKPVSLSNKPVKFQIKNLETYNNELKKEMSTDNISSLISKLDKCNTEEVLVQVVLSTNEMYVNAANKIKQNSHTKPGLKQNTNKTKPINRKPWYNNDCKKLKHNLNYIKKAIDRDPTDPQKRQLIYKTQKTYRRLLKYRRRQYEEQIMEKMENLYSQDKNEFWKFLKSIKERSQKEELPQIDTLIDHFQTLYFKDFKETVNDKNHTPSEPIEKKNNKFDTINSEIGEKEVQSTINNLKQKKSPVMTV